MRTKQTKNLLDAMFPEMTEAQFIQSLVDKNLGFGWYNGKFVTTPEVVQL